jgi:PAS domain S-box-containing protein
MTAGRSGGLGNRTPSIVILRWLCAVVFAAAVLAGPPLDAHSVNPDQGKNVLVFFSFNDRQAFASLEPLKAEIQSRLKVPVNFHVEYLDASQLGDDSYQKGVAQSVAAAFGSKKIDLVIAAAYPALRFATEHRPQMFPVTPIVFMMVVRERLEGAKLAPGITGVIYRDDANDTVNLAARLHPDTQNAVVIAGTSDFEKFWQRITDRAIDSHAPKLNRIDLVVTDPETLLRSVAALPPRTIAFFQIVPGGSRLPATGVYELLEGVAMKLPTYCVFEYPPGHGAVGGIYPDPSEMSAITGKMAARILSGEKPEAIPVMTGTPSHAKVDWLQLQRWHVADDLLPPGTIALNRPAIFWIRYRAYLIAAAVLLCFQTALIAALLWERSKKQKAKAILGESERRFRTMAETTPSLVWMSDPNGKVVYLNGSRIAFTGRDPEANFDDAWSTYIHPDDLQPVMDANRQSLIDKERFAKEYRLRRNDGEYRWMLDVAAPRINGDGQFAGFIGAANDITDQKAAQEALEKISGRLIEAQEKERKRIARELHDDICQRLAMLSVELSAADLALDDSNSAARSRISKVQQHCVDIASSVQSLSHQLHSAHLEYLGLSAALANFCGEFSKQNNVSVEYFEEDVPNPLPQDVTLCLFRVAQEALHNAIKYSGSTKFTVRVKPTHEHIVLEVKDFGKGFDITAARRAGGLGLLSMQERLNLLHGVLSIESAAAQGTTIRASVPIERTI